MSAIQQEIFHRAIYDSILDAQKDEQKHSKIFIINDAKYSTGANLTPIELLHYLTGKEAHIIGIYQNYEGDNPKVKKKLAFEPINLETDEHIMLNKLPASKAPFTNFKIERLIKRLTFDDMDVLIKAMQRRAGNHRDAKYSVIHSLRLRKNHLVKDMRAALNIWFGGLMEGPFCITRVLSVGKLQPNIPSVALASDITRELIATGGEYHNGNYWSFDPANLVIVDKRAYILNQYESDFLSFPRKIKVPFVEIQDPMQCVHSKNETVIEIIKTSYTEKKYKDNKDYAINTVIAEDVETGNQRFKVMYGQKVFINYYSVLRQIVNSSRFIEWAKRSDFEIWYGRDELTKIQDCRNLKAKVHEYESQLKEYQEEVKKLKDELSKQRGNPSNNNDK